MMPRVALGQRKRAYKPKTRSGCKTCKRVKCGEERPSCLKCTSTGRACDGYELTAEIEAPAVQSSTSNNTIISRNPTILAGNEREQRSFHFFSHTTASQLSGYFGEDLFDRLILQASHFEPALKHAVIALGSLHERFVVQKGLLSKNDSHNDFALHQYSLAIRTLREQIATKKRLSTDVCLVACTLFSCFESMQGSFWAAIAHIQSGIKILHETQYNEKKQESQHQPLEVSRNPYVPVSKIEDLFLRLGLQVSQMIGQRDTGVYQHNWRAHHIRSGNLPIFTNLSMAREYFILSWHHCQFLLEELDKQKSSPDFQSHFAAWQKTCLDTVDTWNVAFNTFLKNHEHTISDKEKKGTIILHILKTIGFVALRINHPLLDDQTLWDQFCPLYERVVDLAEEITRSDTELPKFTLDIGIIGPLYEVVARCRDPFIRRRALALLKSAYIQEGVWNSSLTAMVGERVMQIEEEGLGEVKCCADVPDWARISDVSPTFDPMGRKAFLSYMRKGSGHSLVRQPFEEVIEW